MNTRTRTGIILGVLVLIIFCGILWTMKNNLTTVSNVKPCEVIRPPQPNYRVSSLSKDVVIPSAYFDFRPSNGHSNVTILFANINHTILDSKWILGCGTDSIRASSYKVYSIFENILMRNWLEPRPFTYENMLCCAMIFPPVSAVKYTLHTKPLWTPRWK